MISLIMKKLGAGAATLTLFLSVVANALAQTASTANLTVNFPNMGVNPNGITVGNIIGNALMIAMIVAAVIVLFYIVIGAFQWITSGGEKEKVGKARGTIIHAIIGLAILALAGVIIVVVGQILNINILNLGAPPSLNNR
jgi:hypothetical protein